MSGRPAESLTATQIISMLDLQPHPEGGHFRETFRDGASDGKGRAASTLIYFLLAEGETSHWHRVDAAEVWHYYAGSPLALAVSRDGHDSAIHTLGPDLITAQQPQYVVEANEWQAARSLGNWTLVGCSVAPGFTFEGFEMASPDWQPANFSW